MTFFEIFIEAQFHEHFYSFPRLPNVEVIIANIFRSDATARPPALRLCRSVFYTPTVASTPRRIEEEVRALRMALSYLDSTEIFVFQYSASQSHHTNRARLCASDKFALMSSTSSGKKTSISLARQRSSIRCCNCNTASSLVQM